MAALPLWEVASRRLGVLRIPGSSQLVKHLTLVIAFLGAVVAARSGRLLALSTAQLLPEGVRRWVKPLVSAAAVAVTGAMAAASTQVVSADRVGGDVVALGIPVWVFEALMPGGFLAMTGWLILAAAPDAAGRWAAAAGLLIPAAGALVGGDGEFMAAHGGTLRALGVAALLILAPLGMPIYAVLAGLALVLFWTSGIPAAAVAVETVRLAANDYLPAVPLFTLAGYVLAAGGACNRLVAAFRAWLGWMPGGLAVVTAVVFAFFTSFTGASGVTILSLGGLLLPVLVKSQYPERFSLGLVTASGAIGLLFPPSLPVILYGVRSLTQTGQGVYVAPIDELFVAGIVPGLLLVGLVAALGIRAGLLAKAAGRAAFDAAKARRAAWDARWELCLPAVIVAAYFSGLMTLVETAALTVVYALVAEILVHRDVTWRGVPSTAAECAALVGGVLVILGAALGFTNWLVDARIPTLLLEFVRVHVDSRITFLLLLNLFLLAVGCLMDIYSAILVVVPLITPMGAAFGVDPVHLGIIFLANLELGYLTPPVGMNLFLSAYRFGQPVGAVVRSVLPFLAVLVLGLALITYVPDLSLALLRLYRSG
jgi:C4-dicarboxylate transporter DctM subunit